MSSADGGIIQRDNLYKQIHVFTANILISCLAPFASLLNIPNFFFPSSSHLLLNEKLCRD